MQKKLTISIDEKVYEGLHDVIGPRKISNSSRSWCDRTSFGLSWTPNTR